MIFVGSDFSGVGAFDQALNRLGIKYNTVFACDMDKYARQTFVHNYGEPDYFPENVYDREIPKESLDIYMTSPPCQAFSLAGKRKGEDDKRGILFYNSHEFIKKNNPRYFIFENVKGLLSDSGGLTFRRWCEYLGGKSINGNPIIFPHEESVPYHIYFKVLNAKNYNIPQNRERVFIIGIRDDEDNNFTWPKEIFLERRLRDVLENDVDEKYYLSDEMLEKLILWEKRNKEAGNGFGMNIKTCDDICNTISTGSMKSSSTYIKGYINQNTQASLVYDLNGIGQTLCAGTHGYANGYVQVKSATTKGFELAEIGKDSINFEQPNSETRRGRKSVHTNLRIRRLTPRECFRLMDFADTFTWPVSDTQAYKQAGNSICVGVLAGIISKLKL